MKARWHLVLGLQLFLTIFAFSQEYSPKSTVAEKEEDDSADRYNKYLKAFREAPLGDLSKQSNAEQLYRFLWLRSFHHPIVVRIDVNPDGSATVITKITNGAGGYEPGKLIVNRSAKIGSDQTKVFLNQIDEDRYWSLPAEEKQEPNVAHLDGAEWILEGVRNGNHKTVERWSPDNGPIRSLGLTMLLDYAKLKLLYEEVY